MKAQLVYERIDFERGGNPLKKMGIGKIAIILSEYERYLNSKETGHGLFGVYHGNTIIHRQGEQKHKRIFTNYEEGALIWASSIGKLEYVKYLIKAGINPHVSENSPFNLACMKNKLNIVKYLFEEVGDIDINMNDGEPLRWAIYHFSINNKEKDLLIYILEKEANYHLADLLDLNKKEKKEIQNLFQKYGKIK